MHPCVCQCGNQLLNLRSLLCTTLGKAIDLPAYSCVKMLARALFHQDTETHSTRFLQPFQTTARSTVRSWVYNYDPCNYSMSLIKYIVRFLSIPHSVPGLPLRLPLNQPCQDNLSPISLSPLYQFPSTGLFGYLHVTIRSPI